MPQRFVQNGPGLLGVCILGVALSFLGGDALASCKTGEDPTPELVENLLNRMGSGPANAPACGGVQPGVSGSRWSGDSAWPTSVCRPFYNLGSVCEAAETYCRARNALSPACAHDQWQLSPATGQLGVNCVSDETLLAVHREKIEYAGRRFHELKTSPELQARCCGSDSGCRNRFSRVKLRVLLGLGADDITGYFNNRPPSRFFDGDSAVEASVGKLVSYVTPAAMDGFFFHELGHVCHSVRLNSGKGWLRETLPEEMKQTVQSLRGFVGAEVASCVQEGLDRAWNSMTPDARDRADRAEWFEEAHADAIYAASRFATPAGIAWQCSAEQDSQHASPQSYLGCFLMQESLKTKICGESS